MVSLSHSWEFEKQAARRVMADAMSGVGTARRMIAEFAIAAIIASPALLFGYWQAALAAIALLIPVHFAWSGWSITRSMFYESQAILLTNPTERLQHVRESILHFVDRAPKPDVKGLYTTSTVAEWFDSVDSYLQTALRGHLSVQFNAVRMNNSRTVGLGVSTLRSIADSLSAADLR